MTENTTASGAADAISGASEAILGQLEDALVEWNGYVAASDAPRTLREHASPHIKMLKAELGRLHALAASAPVAPTPPASITLDFKQATELLDMYGGEPTEVTLQVGDGHSGKGVYAHWAEIPEEGAMFLGVSDYEATPEAAPVAPAPQPAPEDEDGKAFRTAAQLGLTLRFYGGCAQSSMPGSPSAYEVVTGLDRAETMRTAIERAAAVIANGGEAQKLSQSSAPQQGEYLPEDWKELADLIVKGCCESDVADPEHPDTVCINVHHLLGEVKGRIEEFRDADRAARGAAQAAPAEHMVIDWPLYNKDPLLELDEIYADYSKSFGTTPGPAMAAIVRRHQARLQSWFGGHREEIRSALVAQAAPAPVAEDASLLDFLIDNRAYVASAPNSGVEGYWLQFQPEDGDAWVQPTEHETPREAIRTARAQAAQPEGGAKP